MILISVAAFQFWKVSELLFDFLFDLLFDFLSQNEVILSTFLSLIRIRLTPGAHVRFKLVNLKLIKFLKVTHKQDFSLDLQGS